MTYYRKPDGRLDESVMVLRSLKTRDICQCSVIVDFKNKKVLKASVEGNSVPLVFDTIIAYYLQHYQQLINDLAQHYGFSIRTEESSTDKLP